MQVLRRIHPINTQPDFGPAAPRLRAGVANRHETELETAESLLRGARTQAATHAAEDPPLGQYHWSSTREAPRRIPLSRRLKNTLRTGAKLSVHYHPQIDMPTGPSSAGGTATRRTRSGVQFAGGVHSPWRRGRTHRQITEWVLVLLQSKWPAARRSVRLPGRSISPRRFTRPSFGSVSRALVAGQRLERDVGARIYGELTTFGCASCEGHTRPPA